MELLCCSISHMCTLSNGNSRKRWIRSRGFRVIRARFLQPIATPLSQGAGKRKEKYTNSPKLHGPSNGLDGMEPKKKQPKWSFTRRQAQQHTTKRKPQVDLLPNFILDIFGKDIIFSPLDYIALERTR